jgi:DNA invertase Pin-like site-specific DNA recombinase
MPSAVAYMRCSGRGQVDGDTWDRQMAAIRACAESQGLEIIHEYREEAVSGKLDEESRPAFQSMIADLLANGCRTIIIESLDRLARQYDIQQQLATYMASKGLSLISANTGENITAALMGDPMRRALVQIQGIFAELDKNMLIAKLRAARQRKKAQTGRGEGIYPFGHDPKRPEEKEVLALILHLEDGYMNSDELATHLNEKGFPSRSGQPWRGSTLRKLIARERSCNVVREKAS